MLLILSFLIWFSLFTWSIFLEGLVPFSFFNRRISNLPSFIYFLRHLIFVRKLLLRLFHRSFRFLILTIVEFLSFFLIINGIIHNFIFSCFSNLSFKVRKWLVNFFSWIIFMLRTTYLRSFRLHIIVWVTLFALIVLILIDFWDFRQIKGWHFLLMGIFPLIMSFLHGILVHLMMIQQYVSMPFLLVPSIRLWHIFIEGGSRSVFSILLFIF